jgi:hypothetical protein
VLSTALLVLGSPGIPLLRTRFPEYDGAVRASDDPMNKGCCMNREGVR